MIDEWQTTFSTSLQIDISGTRDAIQMCIGVEWSCVLYYPWFWHHKFKMWKDASVIPDDFLSQVCILEVKLIVRS
jgi:hypothetical protein